MKNGKRQVTEEIELLNEKRIGMLQEKENYKYLGILKAYIIKQEEMKEKIRKEYLRRKREILKTKLCGRNLITEINTWIVNRDHSKNG